MARELSDWRYLPVHPLGLIFEYLSRRDRLAFVLACPEWKDSVDGAMYWKKVVVHMDEDFFEPSLIYLTQIFGSYIKTLEIGWSNPASNQNTKWPHLRYKDLTKRAGKFLILLFEHFVQLEHLRIFDWYDIFYLRKLSYLLLRLIKHQRNLQSIILNDANLFDMGFVNILLACTSSHPTLKNIHLHYTTYKSRKHFDSWVCANCMEKFFHLEVLSIDCWIFCQFFNRIQQVKHKILHGRICELKELNLYLDDSIKKLDSIPSASETQWRVFFSFFPQASVNLIIKRSMKDNQFKNIMKKHYPLLSFTWHYTSYRDSCQTDCRECLERIADIQANNLEYISVTVPIPQCELLGIIQYVKRKCRNIKSFVFNNVELMEKRNYFEPPKYDYDLIEY